MYEYLNGIISDLGEDYAVIDINGVGFRVVTSKNTIINIKLGSKSKLYTQIIVRDENIIIYGFISRYELEIFKLLLSVSGVGPKAALSLLSSLKPDELALAIATKNSKQLTIAQGIGKKIAERIILELRDKISIENSVYYETHLGDSDNAIQAIEALTSLGYSYNEASNAVAKIENKKESVDILIKEALKQLSRI